MDWINRHRKYKKSKTINIILDVDRYEFKCDVTKSSPRLNEVEISGVVHNELLEELFVNIANVIGINKSKSLLHRFDKS